MLEIIKEGSELDQLLIDFCNGEGKKRSKWNFVRADVTPQYSGGTITAGPKINRNAPCICGSGKKYKKCCLKGERS